MKDLNHIEISNEYLPVNLFKILKEKILLLKGKVQNQQKLAGNIEEEWSLNESIPFFEKYFFSLINKNNYHLNSLLREQRKFKDINKTPLLQLMNLWVNFQKKHEFNPIHNHSGLFSFIIFVQIPYNLNQELKNGPGRLSNSNFSSCLQFHFTDLFGRPKNDIVYVDKTYEGGVYFFNAETMHCVYPFFTSDDYRISVSGNIGWSV
jgi:hypothetical protein